MRGLTIGLGLAAGGFLLWTFRALAAGEGVYLTVNVVRVAALLCAIGGVVAIQRSRSPDLFRIALFGMAAAALIVFVNNVTGAIRLPEDLSTFFGFAGGCLAAYGAYHWYGPRGDALSATFVSAGLVLMAGNPGTYLALGLYNGDLWQGGWLPGTLLSFTGLLMAGLSLRSLAEPTQAAQKDGTRPSGSSGT